MCFSLFPVPTLAVFPESITVTEGESVTLSCIPDDPRVRVEWYYVSQPDFPFQQLGEPIFSSLEPILPSSGVSFDDPEFRYKLTLSIPSMSLDNGQNFTVFAQGQYLCYPQGLDSLDSFESPGNITVNVLESQYIAKLGLPTTLYIFVPALVMYTCRFNFTCMYYIVAALATPWWYMYGYYSPTSFVFL